ncbi:MAG: type II secretion system protein [Patescibacteria group bacterium]|nr:type II secretion system protein [Patescibacteria group bacterium]
MFKQIFSPVNQLKKSLNSSAGFTLIELLVVISIIGFLTVASVVVFNIVRMNARDAVRVGNIATISRSLAMYLNDSRTGYPASAGECLKVSSGVGAELKAAQVLLEVPTDPLWPNTLPSSVTDGAAVSPSQKFCYYYYSAFNNQYKLSYFLESNSKSGNAGINSTVVTQ